MVKTCKTTALLLSIFLYSVSCHAQTPEAERMDKTKLGQFLVHLDLKIDSWIKLLEEIDSRRLRIRYKPAKQLDEQRSYCIEHLKTARDWTNGIRKGPALADEVFLLVTLLKSYTCVTELQNLYLIRTEVFSSDRSISFAKTWNAFLNLVQNQLLEITSDYQKHVLAVSLDSELKLIDYGASLYD